MRSRPVVLAVVGLAYAILFCTVMICGALMLDRYQWLVPLQVVAFFGAARYFWRAMDEAEKES